MTDSATKGCKLPRRRSAGKKPQDLTHTLGKLLQGVVFPVLVWRIPADTPNPARQHTILTDEQKNQMVKRALKGEQRTALAKEYGITPAYVDRLIKRAKKGRNTF
jgi:CENP-B N-terminal DNA-binding domain